MKHNWDDDLGRECVDKKINEETPIETQQALMIGFEHNKTKVEDIPQCILDEVFGKGYLLALKHVKEMNDKIRRENE
jgi:hypothetical protein